MLNWSLTGVQLAFTGIFIRNLWNSLESCWMWKHFSGKSLNYVLRLEFQSLSGMYLMLSNVMNWQALTFSKLHLSKIVECQKFSRKLKRTFWKVWLTSPCFFQRFNCLWKSVGCYHMSREFLFDRPFLTGFLCSKFKFLWKIVGCKDTSSKLFDVNSCLEIDGWQEPQSGVVTSFQQGAPPPLCKRIC